MNTRIIWHGSPCPQEHLAKVEAELEQLLAGPLEIPQALIFHRVHLENDGEVTAWGDTNDYAFHAEYHPVFTKEERTKEMSERIEQFFAPLVVPKTTRKPD